MSISVVAPPRFEPTADSSGLEVVDGVRDGLGCAAPRRCSVALSSARWIAHRPIGRKRPLLARGLGVDAHWLPIPWQELVEAVGGVTVGHALQYVSEPGKGLDVVELCGGDEGADDCPSDAAAVGRGLIVPGVRRAKSWSDIRFIH